MKRMFALASVLLIAGSLHAQGDPLPKLLAQLKSKKAEERSEAFLAIGELGSKAAPAVPTLVAYLPRLDEEDRLLATLALGKIGKPALPAVEKLLDHEDDTTRFYAVWAIGMVGPDARGMTPRVLTMFAKDEDEEVRVKTAFTLGRIGMDDKDALVALGNLAANAGKYGAERLAAIEQLRHFGPAALTPLMQAATDYQVVPQVFESLEYVFEHNSGDAFTEALLPHLPALIAHPHAHQSPVLGGDAMASVLAKHGDKLLPGLRKQLADPALAKRAEAAATLANIANNLVKHGRNPELAAKVLKELAPHFVSRDVLTRQMVASFAPFNTDTEKAFEPLLFDGDLSVRQRAWATVQAHGRDPAAIVLAKYNAAKGDEKLQYAGVLHVMLNDAGMKALLWANLKNKDSAIRHRVACQLATTGYPFEDPKKVETLLVPVLIESLKSDNADRRLQAARSLPAVAAWLPPHAALIFERLDDSSAEIRLAALIALPAVAHADVKRALKKMAVLANSDDPDVRHCVGFVLTALGKEGVPLLVDMALKDKNDTAVSMMCSQLAGMGKEAQAAVPTLLKLAENDANWLDASAALTVIAPEKAFGPLVEILKKRDETLRKALKYEPAVLHDQRRLCDALTNDWKRADVAQGELIAHALVKIQPLLAQKQRNLVVFGSSPAMSQQLAKVKRGLQSKDAKERLQAVATLGQIRRWHAVSPSNFDPVGKDWTVFAPKQQEQAVQIDELFTLARRDADLQVRRLARREQAVDLARPTFGPMFFLPGMPPGVPPFSRPI